MMMSHCTIDNCSVSFQELLLLPELAHDEYRIIWNRLKSICQHATILNNLSSHCYIRCSSKSRPVFCYCFVLIRYESCVKLQFSSIDIRMKWLFFVHFKRHETGFTFYSVFFVCISNGIYTRPELLLFSSTLFLADTVNYYNYSVAIF